MRRSFHLSMLLVSCALLVLVFCARSSEAARMIQDHSTADLHAIFDGAEDWEETELEMDGAGEDFPQEIDLDFHAFRKQALESEEFQP